MENITLHYFGSGVGEGIRMILHYNNTPFIDNRITGEEWTELKASRFYPLNRLPLLEIDGEKLIESLAIKRYLCQKFGYYSNDIGAIYRIEALCSVRADITKELYPSLFRFRNEESVVKWINEHFGKWLHFLEEKLVANGGGNGFFVGDSPTLADFEIFQLYFDHFYSQSERWVRVERLFSEKAPKLKSFIERFPTTSPSFQIYLRNRDNTILG